MLVAAPTGSAETITLGPNSDADPFHSWAVPANVCNATFDLYGAEGSGGVGGARVTTTLSVTPGTVYYVYVGSWGVRGKGSWITVYTNPGHAFAVIAGLRLDTSTGGITSRRITRTAERGPRWRVALRNTRGFKRRHPVGF